MADTVVRSIEAVTHGRFLLRVPPPPGPFPLLVGFHGYGENAERNLEQLRRIPGTDGWLLAAVQGLHRFYTGKMEDIAASWMTRQDRQQAIADNVEYVDRVVAALTREHAPTRLVYCGFSQGVAMAFRAAVCGQARAEAVIALGGDVPPDVYDQPASRFGRVLLARGTGDTWYTDARLQADLAQLRTMRVAVESATFDGGHAWTDAFREAAAQFLHA